MPRLMVWLFNGSDGPESPQVLADVSLFITGEFHEQQKALPSLRRPIGPYLEKPIVAGRIDPGKTMSLIARKGAR